MTKKIKSTNVAEKATDNAFTQLCVWPGVTLGEFTVEEFEEFMKKEFGVTIKFCEVVLTLPDKKKGKIVPDTGGRSDLFFYVRTGDLFKFSIPRLQAGIRWWEDVIKYNDSSKHLYTKEFVKKYPVRW